MATNIALLGAGGKMGRRVTEKIKDISEYEIAYVEVSQNSVAQLAKEGITVVDQDEAVAGADIVILAVPDVLIGKITTAIVPKLKSGAMVVALDPAAAYAGVLAERDDITYFITHPCHPPVFTDEVDPVAQRDWFGGIAKQNIVCALHQGPEEDYAKGENLARAMWAPVMNSHRVTAEQMAILEPALVETLSATCLTIIREGMDEAIKMGVPEAAARDFLYGHLRVELAILFDQANHPFSDAAIMAINNARPRIFREDWKENVMALANIKKSVKEITGTG